MILREIPITSSFPDYTAIKTIASNHISANTEKPLFYDIETTGLSSSSGYCYLIGCIYRKTDTWMLKQWLAETEEEECAILTAFFDFSIHFTYTIQYNGNKFDLPFLLKRCEIHNIKTTFSSIPSIDLFQELKPCKKLLNFQHMKQPDLECFLNIRERTFSDGKNCIKQYKEYCKNKKTDSLNEILGHNTEDLYGLGQIFLMLSYRLLLSGEYVIQNCLWNEPDLILHCHVAHPFPVSFSFLCDNIYLSGNTNSLRILIKAYDRKLKMYYPNYKDYAYLPSEDTAIPKSLSSYIDKSLKTPARPETCYNWFEINERFLNNPEQQYKYLRNLLNFILNH